MSSIVKEFFFSLRRGDGGGAVKLIEFYETVCQYMQCKVHVLTEVFANQSID